jgi:hypothetical protein
VAVLGGGAMDGSPELSLELAPVDLSRRGLHLLDLWKKGILTEVLAGVSDGVCELAMMRQTHGTSVRSQGRCGDPPALISSLVVAVGSPFPHQQLGWGRSVMERHSGGRVLAGGEKRWSGSMETIL